MIRLGFFIVCLVALSATASAQTDYQTYGDGGGGGGSCMVCRGVMEGGVTSLKCTSPDPGAWGQQNCRIESYPEATYCFTDGNDCCVD